MAPSMTACVIVIATCLAWIGGISWALIYFLQLPAMVGWLVAGGLGFSTTVVASIILYEMRHAVDLTDCVDGSEFEGLWGAPWETAPPLPKRPVPALRMRGEVC